MAWAERQMKLGHVGLPPSRPGLYPDLTGLSCRYAPIASEQGVVLSVIVLPVGEPDERFSRLTDNAARPPARSDNEGRPVPAEGPTPALDPRSFDLEARAIRGRLGHAAALPRPGCWPISLGPFCASGSGSAASSRSIICARPRSTPIFANSTMG